jgi:hypothetical protein
MWGATPAVSSSGINESIPQEANFSLSNSASISVPKLAMVFIIIERM